ncbi:MAG TPA: YceI family protein [Acidimicrobiales bacterium]|nr:YceI family protein [Acidimicrobiales bacterium]
MSVIHRSTTNVDLPSGTWNIDPSHSAVEFSVRHLVGKVRGQFKSFSGTIEVGGDSLASRVEASIDLASVDTGDEKRDAHLRSPEFFDVENNPSMTFRSTKVRANGDGYTVVGDLSLRGVNRSVELDLDFNGISPDPWGGLRAGFTATTELSRKDFGLEWNVALEAGGLMVGDKVKVTLEIEAVLV